MDFIQKLWLASFLLNLHFLYAVFDIFFRSPVVPVAEIYSNSFSDFNRVIFIVADGLRADTFYDNPQLRPHLTEIMDGHSSAWGISDAKVPTESRPGHVALFAGIYEDPSSVFAGWKKNLVPFDTAFDTVRFAVLLGSPDIVSLFGRNKSEGMISSSYPSDWQDFLARNSSILDSWVLTEYLSLLSSESIPRHSSVLIFLHLLGIDNTGHAAKPDSAEYKANVQLVDEIIKTVERKSNLYFGDNKTMYIFTSDHGMTDHGSHGDGSAAETETPFVIWGHGIKSANTMQRLHQVDFAALLAGSLSAPFPTNSRGVFPNIWQNESHVFGALVANLFQVRQLMLTKKSVVQDRWLEITPFRAEARIESTFAWARTGKVPASRSQIAEAINTLNDVIGFALEGVVYYERYDEGFLKFLTILTFLIWMLLLVTSCRLVFEGKECNFMFRQYFLYALAVSFILTKAAFGWPIMRILYFVVPAYLARVLISAWKGGVVRLCIYMVLGVEILALSFHYREILSLGLLINVGWYALLRGSIRAEIVFWVQCLLLGIFPLLPIANLSNSVFMTLGPVASVVLTALALHKFFAVIAQKKSTAAILIAQLALLSAISVLVHYPDSVITRVTAWASLALVGLPLFISSENVAMKLFSLFLGIEAPIALLCLNYETLFLPCLFVVLLQFLRLELSLNMEFPVKFSSLTFQDLASLKPADLDSACRTAWLQVFFTYYSFFGIGNIASISSFNPSASRCFLSVFNPFLMMILLLLKIIGGFLLVSLVSQLCTHGKNEVSKKFLIVILLSQGMSLHMFMSIKNEGSWAQIGTSISHFVIVQVSTLFLLLLHYIAAYLLQNSYKSSQKLPVRAAGKAQKAC